MLYVLNSFSLSMLQEFRTHGCAVAANDTYDTFAHSCQTFLKIETIHSSEVQQFFREHKVRDHIPGFVPIVDNSSMAAIFSDILGEKIPLYPINATLTEKDELLVGQYVGPKLEEGTTKLPEGAEIHWLWIELCDI